MAEFRAYNDRFGPGMIMDRILFGLRTFIALAVPYFRSEERWRARGLLAGVICGELGYVLVAVLVIQWNARFFNALEARNWNAFKAELVVFAFITAGDVPGGMAPFFFCQSLLLSCRPLVHRPCLAASIRAAP